MRWTLRVACYVFFLIGGGLFAVHATDAPPVEGAVAVVNAWSRATAPGVSVGVIYFEIDNPGAMDTLLAIETSRADHVSMHVTTKHGDTMQMRELESVDVPTGARIVFAPGGRHAMLMGLKMPLVIGEKIPLVLTFKRSGPVRIDVVVRGTDPVPQTDNAIPDATPAFRLTAWPSMVPSPDFALTDDEGRSRTLRDYRGQVVVVVFGFLHCADVCPTELLKLSLAVKQLGGAGDLVSVLFVTLDPLRDSAALLKNYVTTFDPRFVGLTGSGSQVDRAAANFHVQYARVNLDDGYTLDHSTAVYIFDKTGKLRLLGAYSSSADDFASDLRILALQR